MPSRHSWDWSVRPMPSPGLPWRAYGHRSGKSFEGTPSFLSLTARKAPLPRACCLDCLGFSPTDRIPAGIASCLPFPFLLQSISLGPVDRHHLAGSISLSPDSSAPHLHPPSP